MNRPRRSSDVRVQGRPESLRSTDIFRIVPAFSLVGRGGVSRSPEATLPPVPCRRPAATNPGSVASLPPFVFTEPII